MTYLASEKLKICFISNEYPPETGFGGIGTYTYNLAQGLSKLGHRVTVISQAVDKERDYKDGGVRVIRIFNKRVPLRGLTRVANLFTDKGFTYWWHSRSVFLKIQELIEREGRFDVIEGPLWDGECLAYPSKLKIPLVIRLQTPIFKSLEILDKKSRKILELIEERSLQKATLIAAISHNIGELISRRYGISPKKIIYSPLGIEMPRFSKPIFKKNSFKLLYVGRLEKRKGTDEFIQAIPKILEENSKINIDIVGKDCFQAPGGISYLKYFEEIVPAKLRKRVNFFGFVDGKKLKYLYTECDLFIAPSRYESFGLIFLEAMGYGKPVIGTRVGGIPEIIKKKGVGLLIDVNSPDQIAKAVLAIFADESLRKRLGEKAFSYVREQFDVGKMVENSLKIYNQAISIMKNG